MRSFYVGKKRPPLSGADWQEPRPVASKPAADPWSVLGVKAGATQAEIKIAFRAAARKAHPDVGGTKEKMQAVNIAYDILRGKRRR